MVRRTSPSTSSWSTALPRARYRFPLRVGVGFGDPGRLVDACDAHVVTELDLGLVHRAFDRCGTGRLRCAGQRDVAFTCHQPRSGVEPNPAGARQVHLAPSVQVGEVVGGAARAVECFHVGRELDQVARHKPCRQAAVAQQLHEQPARIAAGTTGLGQRFLGRLHARLHADQVVDVTRDLLVQRDQEIDGAARCAVDRVEVALQQGRRGFCDQVGCELLLCCVAL